MKKEQTPKIVIGSRLEPLKDILMVGAIYIIAQIAVAVVLSAMGIVNPEDIYSEPFAVLVAYMCAGLLTAGLVYALMRFRRISLDLLKFHKFRWKDLGYALAGYVFYVFVLFVVSIIMRLIPGIDVDQKQDVGLGTLSNNLLPLTFVALAIVTPLAEEILFRGFLYGRLKYHKFTPLIAALFTSLAFGFVHGQLNVGVDTFILSMIMIYMYEKSQNLWVTVTIHAIKNTVAFLALFVFKIV